MSYEEPQSIQPIHAGSVESSCSVICKYPEEDLPLQSPIYAKEEPNVLSNVENGREVKFYFDKLIKLDEALLLFCTIDLTFTILYTDSDYYARDVSEITPNLCLYILLALLAMSLVVIFLRYRAQVELSISRFQLSKQHSLWSSGSIPSLIFDVLMMSIQPYPFLNDTQIQTLNVRDNYSFEFKLNYALALGGFFKIFIIARILLQKTHYMSPRSVRVGKMYQAENGYLYAIKGLFMDSPMMLIGMSFLVSIFCFALAIRICQRNLMELDKIHGITTVMNLEDLTNVIWFTIITMTTVGYGDFYPRTLIGRIIDVFLIVWGSVIVSLIIVVLTNSLTMDMSQRRALTVLNRLDLQSSEKQQAASYIGNFLRLRKEQSKLKTVKAKEEQTKAKKKIDTFTYMLYNNSKQIHQIKKQMQAMLEFDDLYEQLTRQFDSFMDEVDEFIDTQIKVEDDLAKFISAKS